MDHTRSLAVVSCVDLALDWNVLDLVDVVGSVLNNTMSGLTNYVSESRDVIIKLGEFNFVDSSRIVNINLLENLI